MLAPAVYWPAIHSGFIWDDNALLTGNALVQVPDGLRYIWFSTLPVDYFPLTLSSFWAEWRVWGSNPTGYHLVNVLLHAGSAVLLWRVLANLRIPGGYFAALLFLVHPVNVESVAWIAERKNTLALMFCLLSLLLYLRFDSLANQPTTPRSTLHAPRFCYFLSLLAFLLSLLSKTAGVMLPFVLLSIAWWQRHREPGVTAQQSGHAPRPPLPTPRSTLYALRSPFPFFALSLVFGLVTVWFQYHRAIGAEVIHHRDGLERLAGAGSAVWFYLGKALWPVRLMFVYPEWRINPGDWLAWVPDVALAGVFLVLWFCRKAWGRAGLLVLGTYVAMLFPVLGFFRIYFQKYTFVADHWQYFALPALLAGLAALLDRPPWQSGRRALLVALIGACVLLTWRQQRLYKDEETLWVETLKQNPACWMALNNLGGLLVARGQPGEAADLYRRSIEAHPSQVEAYNNLGLLFFGLGRNDEAMAQFRRALAVNPDLAMTRLNIGNVLVRRGQAQEAFVEFQTAARLQPDLAEAHNNLGCLLSGAGRQAEAADQFREALKWKPEYADARNNLGQVLAQLQSAVTNRGRRE